MLIAELEPKVVWEHFQALCDTPRPSKYEEQIRDYLKGWAELKGLEHYIDAVGNLIIRKPASPGREQCPGVVLQGHLDMVCQANSGVAHDFFHDPIKTRLEQGWLKAEETTLGADNGIGVALALAVLASDDLLHGPIEALFTLDEEQGMGGAQGLEKGVLRGQYLINLDTEEWGEFYMGCAGGVDVNVDKTYHNEAIPEGYPCVQLAVTGLRGGHSGSDIHLGRGNANKILLSVLNRLQQLTRLRIASFHGGSARNALAREAFAVLAFPAQDEARVKAEIESLQRILREELLGVDEGLCLNLSGADASEVMSHSAQKVIIAALNAAPHGVKRMSQRVPGVVETSNNLGVIKLGQGQFHCNFMVRSLIDAGALALADEIVSLFSLIDAEIKVEGHYPGWAPNPDSRLLAVCRQVFQREFKQDSEVKVIHAGLECGIIGAKYPQMDMVSFGPNIRGAHAPGERVEVASVGRAWHLLQAILGELAA